jgi:gamma-glutamylcyclotransferase (GGCT)/AIG2-like uncharacterized protein YtfP
MILPDRKFFFYGTLLDRDVRYAVLGRSARNLTLRTGELRGQRRVRAPGRSYPVLVSDSGGCVPGLLCESVTQTIFRRLMEFEGAMYRAAPCIVFLPDGSQVAAAVFAACRAMPANLPDWDFEEWRRCSKRRFLAGLDREVPRAAARS